MRWPTVRQIHTYVGVAIAPSVLFFAMTGAVQLLGLHEAHGGYHPPQVLEQLSSMHKDQHWLSGPEARPPAAPSEPAPLGSPKPAEHKILVSTIALKLYFLAVATGLITSTLLGLWMSLRRIRGKGGFWIALVIGAAAPIILMLV